MKSGKIVFAQFESESCDECNEVADRAFKDAELGRVIAQRCIAIKIDVLNKDRAEFRRLFPSVTTMGTYFILGSGELLHRYTKTITLPSAYINEIDTAYNKWQEGMVTLKELDEEWNNNAGNISAMEKYLDKRLALNLPADSLLDIYVRRLPSDSFNSKRILIFIANHAPITGTEADRLLRKNFELFKRAWLDIPLQERISINRRIIAKSLQKAIYKKDENLVNWIAAFQTGTYEDRNSEDAKKYNQNLYLSYYLGIKDYSSYFKAAVPYFDNYYMNRQVSALRQQDSIKLQLLSENIKGDTVRNGNGFAVRKRFSYTPLVQYYSKDLNEGAWIVYIATQNKDLLNKALQWAKRANELYSSAASMDTYARLLYKTGNTKEGIEWETKAIEHQKKRNVSYRRFEDVLQKMNKGEAKIDEHGL